MPTIAGGKHRTYDAGRAAIAILRVAANVADEETVTIGGDVYEFDRADDGVETEGAIAVTAHEDDTPANATDALIAAINSEGTEHVKAIDIGDNEVLIVSADGPGGNPIASDATTELAEDMAGSNNAWDTAALRGGRLPDHRAIAIASRVPNAAEVALGNMHFVVPFTPATVVVQVRVTATGVVKAWDGGYAVSSGRITLTNAGDTDWAATDTVTVIAAE